MKRLLAWWWLVLPGALLAAFLVLAGDDVTTRDKEYRCEDYGVDGPLPPRHVIALVFLGVATISLLVGIFRGANFLWRLLLCRA